MSIIIKILIGKTLTLKTFIPVILLSRIGQYKITEIKQIY